MSLLSGISSFFGLDIGTTAVRLVELHGSSAPKVLTKYAYVPLDARISISDSQEDHHKLAIVIKDLCAQAKMTTKNVAVGIPSQRVFTTVVDIDRMTNSELAKSIKYQADSLIPTPLTESKIDWALLGDSPVDKTKVEILISSVTNKFVEDRLDIIESAGLNVIAFEPDNLALTRSILAPGATLPQMVIDIGYKSTDLVIAMNGVPHLTRAISTGSEAIIKSAAQNLNIDEKQAEKFIFKFGLNKDKLEGQTYEAIIGTIDTLTGEIEKSIDFFQARYVGSKMERIIVTGGASSMPGFPLYMANKFNINVEIGNAWHNISFAESRQNELLAVSNYFGVAAGLAERLE
jgi:type IV pilus assembly protein PilM